MTGARILRSLCIALLATAAGCVVSPQPSPPEIALSGIGIDLSPAVELAGNIIGFDAAPGTVDPAKGQVVVTNLDTADAPSLADVQPDGSFAIAVPGLSGQSFRFQAKDGNARSEPFDLVVGVSGSDVSALDASPACLVIEPASWIGFQGVGEEQEVVLANGCAGAVSIASPRFRRGLAGFSAFPAAPLTIAAGDAATITVRAGDGVEAEDVIVFDITAPATSRRDITLTVPDR